ncbi:MAG: hypothetical protein KatS3mg035_0122 [Bacteroidia bacterium]|nr:MAG: hypothetical protein KatS3mg035_0122 [Bacteroidia bacterium]
MKKNKLYFILLILSIFHLIFPIWIAQNVDSHPMSGMKFLMLLLCAVGGILVGGGVVGASFKTIAFKTVSSSAPSSTPAIIATSVFMASTLYLAHQRQTPIRPKTESFSQNKLLKNDSLTINLNSTKDSIYQNQKVLDLPENKESDTILKPNDEITKKDTINYVPIDNQDNLNNRNLNNQSQNSSIPTQESFETEKNKKNYPVFYLEPIQTKIKFKDTLANIHSERIQDIWVRTPRKSDLIYGSKNYFILYPSNTDISRQAINNFIQSDLMVVNVSNQKSKNYNIIKVVRKVENFFSVEYHVYQENGKGLLVNYFRLFSPQKFTSVSEAIKTKEFILSKL